MERKQVQKIEVLQQIEYECLRLKTLCRFDRSDDDGEVEVLRVMVIWIDEDAAWTSASFVTCNKFLW